MTPFASDASYTASAARCVAALHVNYLRTSSQGSSSSPIIKTEELVDAYQNLGSALASFRTQVKAVDQSNLVACVAFAMSILIFNLDNARRAPPEDFKSIVVEAIKALRSTSTIRSSFMSLTQESILVQMGDLESEQRELEIAVQITAGEPKRIFEQSLDKIDDLIQRLERETAQQIGVRVQKTDDYRRLVLGSGRDLDSRLLAAVALRTWAIHIGLRPRQWSDVLFWPWCTTIDFISLLDARDSAALVVTVYWFAFISRSVKRWYLDGWARRAAAVAIKQVGPGWDEILLWPKMQMGLD